MKVSLRRRSVVWLALSIASFLLSLRGNGEESDCSALNYPSLSPSFSFSAFIRVSSFALNLSFTSFLPFFFFFLCLPFSSASQTLGLWGVTLQESGCNNTAVICLDLIWSQSSWERKGGRRRLRERCAERWIKKGRESGSEKKTDDNKRDRGETVCASWETDCVLGGSYWAMCQCFIWTCWGSRWGASVVVNRLTSPI